MPESLDELSALLKLWLITRRHSLFVAASLQTFQKRSSAPERSYEFSSSLSVCEPSSCILRSASFMSSTSSQTSRLT